MIKNFVAYKQDPTVTEGTAALAEGAALVMPLHVASLPSGNNSLTESSIEVH